LDVKDGSHAAHRVSDNHQRNFGGTSNVVTFVSQHRVHDDGRQKTERPEPDRGKRREWAFEPHLRQLVRRQRAEIPDEAEDRRQQQEGIKTGTEAGRPTRPDNHGKQHGVQDDASA